MSSPGSSPSPSKFNMKNPAIKRIMQEMKEMRADTGPSAYAYYAEAVEDDIFEWHFAIFGPEDSEFDGGVYHGRILLPPEYPFKPPSFMLLTPSGEAPTDPSVAPQPTREKTSPRGLGIQLTFSSVGVCSAPAMPYLLAGLRRRRRSA